MSAGEESHPAQLAGWEEPDGQDLDELARYGALAADLAVIGFQGTGAQRTRIAVRAALRMLLANGLVTAVPAQDRPGYVQLAAP